ncbi:MAG: TIGR04282 family arsenosugar biosynthesis glycosyltransferase [Acidobacteria bacterium]|nr:TIGR04282 family arsenosugar biosynthesis glycosyltransferase [Acidobacteriota bacterium]
MSDTREVLVLFARFPEPGRTKTRLVPLLGPEGAATAYRRVAEATAREAVRLDRPGIERVVCVEPASKTGDVSRWLGSSFSYRPQVEGDLGHRLAASFADVFARSAARVVVLGTDCPGLDASILGRAFDALTSHDAVLGPAADGGYYLIGLARPLPGVFAEITWSTAEVAEISFRRLRDLGASVSILEVLRDLDTPEDFEVLAARWPDLLSNLVGDGSVG